MDFIQNLDPSKLVTLGAVRACSSETTREMGLKCACAGRRVLLDDLLVDAELQ
jgi:hypothetical protein